MIKSPLRFFSTPPIGTVGLSEQEARTKGLDIKVYKTDFRPMKYALSDNDERCFMKINRR